MKITAMRRWVHIALIVSLLALGTTIVWQVCRNSHPGKQAVVMFRGKPLEAWFYGSRTDFFHHDTRQAAQEALKGVGTNAFPFLLATLKAGRGSPLLYQRAYQAIPGWMKTRIRFPISEDDIKAVTLNHLWEMREQLSTNELQALANCLPRLRNARIRLRAFSVLRERYPSNPQFRSFYRKLLDDADPAIRLEAAIPLAESANVSDPAEPRLALILMDALASKEIRDHWVDINRYTFQQQPPGSSSTRSVLYARLHFQDQGEVLQRRIRTALKRLQPYLSAEQKARFDQLNKPVTNGTQQVR